MGRRAFGVPRPTNEGTYAAPPGKKPASTINITIVPEGQGPLKKARPAAPPPAAPGGEDSSVAAVKVGDSAQHLLLR